MKKTTDLNKIITVLTVLCVCTAVILSGLIGVYFMKKNSSVAFVSGADSPRASTTVKQTTSEVSTTEKSAESTTVASTQSTTVPVFSNNNTTSATVSTTQSTTQSTTLIPENERIVVNPEQELWNLVVVNAGREMPEGYVPELACVAGTSVKMDYRVAPWYDKMYYAAKRDGITLTPYSGYRSYERQKINYNNLTEKYMSRYSLSRAEAAAKAATVILPPGTSEHNLGLAMDICNTYDSFAGQKEFAWLTEHAHEYGFILRYTAEKQSVTGIVPEPWHWRYVGVEYAEKIKNSGLCLEEYLDSVGIAY
ncbi:MAG: M15 family metallopeptidase [Clostridia bacterium]|nr:M15 family metallopeptidase [Clostridia bacterium]